MLAGRSEAALVQLHPTLAGQSVLYWLDAHGCDAVGSVAVNTACPLLHELNAIGQLNAESVLLIDDARLFLAPPQAPHDLTLWPGFHQVCVGLQALSSGHELMVINDVIVFYPPGARQALQAFARQHGIDWLAAARYLQENAGLLEQLQSKEAVIQEKEAEIQRLHVQISNNSKNLQRYSALNAMPLLGSLFRASVRLSMIIRPRLGFLDQYAPKPVTQNASLPRVALERPPRISVVTPSFQQGAFIERTILSLLTQDYPALEYYVQDGGSSDSTVSVLRKYQAQLSGWSAEKDSGQSQAINRGFAKTSGEIMAWLNSDDVLLPGALHTVAAYFNDHPAIDVVYGNRLMIDEQDQEIGRWIMPGHNSKVLSWADYIPQETLFFRRSIWEKAGGAIDESFRFAMDWDLLVRLRDAGARFAHIPRFLGAFRIHTRQKTSAEIGEIGYREMGRIRQRVLGRIPAHKEIRRALMPFLLKHVLVDLAYRVRMRYRLG